MIWLTGQLAPDFKTIADFRKNNGNAICEVCRDFVAPCRNLICSVRRALPLMDRSSRRSMRGETNFTEAKTKRRYERIDESIARYLRRWWLCRSETRKGACLNRALDHRDRQTIRCRPRASNCCHASGVERTIAWLNRNRRLEKDFVATIASAEAWHMITRVKLLLSHTDLPEHDPPRINYQSDP
jgi:hypothetical protein